MPIAIEQDLVWRPATASTPAHSIVSHGEPFTGEEPRCVIFSNVSGTTYYYFRDERFDANTFFSNRSTLAKPNNNQNQFGGSLGGPLRKGTAFFFADYEGTRITRGVLRTGTVPTADQRRGVFSSAIRDPQSGLPFENNTIPSSRIDRVAAAILEMVPMPNAPGSSNFIRQPDITDDSDRFSGRFDLRGSSNDNFFMRYSYNNRFRFVPGWFGGLLDGSSTSAWGPGSQGGRRHGDDRIRRGARREPHGRHHRRRRAGAHPHGLAELHAQVAES